MKEIPIKKHIRYLFGITILVFILNKLYLRPWVVKNELSGFFQIFVFSIPNLIEAIVGTLILTGLLLQFRQFYYRKLGRIKDIHIYIIAIMIYSIYVISQELKFHNLGGNNVYDPFDLLASIIGLVIVFWIIQVFGFIEKKI